MPIAYIVKPTNPSGRQNFYICVADTDVAALDKVKSKLGLSGGNTAEESFDAAYEAVAAGDLSLSAVVQITGFATGL